MISFWWLFLVALISYIFGISMVLLNPPPHFKRAIEDAEKWRARSPQPEGERNE